MEESPAAVLALVAAWVERWTASTWAPRARAEQLSAIFTAALASPDAQVRELAEDTIHRAASAGHLQFRRLLSQALSGFWAGLRGRSAPPQPRSRPQVSAESREPDGSALELGRGELGAGRRSFGLRFSRVNPWGA